jgi:hypothetical protein
MPDIFESFNGDIHIAGADGHVEILAGHAATSEHKKCREHHGQHCASCSYPWPCPTANYMNHNIP